MVACSLLMPDGIKSLINHVCQIGTNHNKQTCTLDEHKPLCESLVLWHLATRRLGGLGQRTLRRGKSHPGWERNHCRTHDPIQRNPNIQQLPHPFWLIQQTYSVPMWNSLKLIEAHWNSTYQAAFLLVPGGAPTCGTTDGDTARINGAMWTGPQNNAWYILVHPGTSWYIGTSVIHFYIYTY